MYNKLTIVTNNVARRMLRGCELTSQERKEFDYISADDFDTHSFVRYRKRVYDIGEFVRVDFTDSPLSNWHGYASDTVWSGVCVKFVEGGEQVIIGRYYS